MRKLIVNLTIPWFMLLGVFLCSCATDDQQAEEGLEASQQGQEQEEEAFEETSDVGSLGAVPVEEVPAVDESILEPPTEIAEDPGMAQGMGLGEGEPKAEPAIIPDEKIGQGGSPGADKRVWYISSQLAPIYAKPDLNTPSIGVRERGDHLLLKVDGEWAEIGPSSWIQSIHLTTRPVGRGQPAALWRARGTSY